MMDLTRVPHAARHGTQRHSGSIMAAPAVAASSGPERCPSRRIEANIMLLSRRRRGTEKRCRATSL